MDAFDYVINISKCNYDIIVGYGSAVVGFWIC